MYETSYPLGMRLYHSWPLDNYISNEKWYSCTITLLVASFPGSLPLRIFNNSSVWPLNLQDIDSGREPGRFYHVSDVKGRENSRKSRENLLRVTEGVTAVLTPPEHSHLRAYIALCCTIFRVSVAFTTSPREKSSLYPWRHSRDKISQALSPNFQWPSEFKGHTMELLYARDIRKGREPGNEATLLVEC